MTPEWVSFGNPRVIEVFRWIVCHSKFLHHTLRTGIDRCGKGNNFLQSEHLKRMAKDGVATLRCQSPPPNVLDKPPSDFYTGSEGSLKHRDVDADESDQLVEAS